MKPQIIVDSGCDMNPSLLDRIKAHFISFIIHIGGKEYTDDKGIDTTALLNETAGVEKVGTACPSPEAFAEKMRLAGDCFVVTISSRLSGCYNAALMARDMVLEENPAQKIHVFDSKSATSGETRIVLFLQECIDADLPYEEIIGKTEAFIRQMKTRFILDDLGNLVKNGRLSKLAGMLGNLLHIRPILGDNGDGEIVALGKGRGQKQATRKLIDMVVENTKNAAESSLTLVMSYCHCFDRAVALKEELLEKCAALREIILVPTSGLSSIYANNGGIVLAY